MALQPQIVKLVQKLVELTERKKISWESTADEETFLTSAGNFVVTVARGLGTVKNEGYRIRVLNESGQRVEEGVAIVSDRFDYARDDPGARAEAALLGSLHEIARRSALHSDKVVADLLVSLEQIR